MCSIRSRLAIFLLTVAAGCSTQEKLVYDPVNPAPVVGDDAIALRSDWPKSVSKYQSGAVIAFSTRYPYSTNATHPEPQNLVVEPVMFIAQMAMLPVELVANPPFQPQVWYTVEYPPTYTAQPPLPPPGGARATYNAPFSYTPRPTPGSQAGLPGQAPGEPLAPLPPAVPAAPSPIAAPGAPGGVGGPPIAR